MKNIIKILKFEYLSCVKNKAFIIITVFLMGIMLLSAFLPALLMGLLSEDKDDENGQKPVISISSEVYDKALIKSEFESLFTETEIKVTKESINELTKKVDSGDYEFAVKIDNELKFTYITANNSLFSEDYQTISDAVKSMYTVKTLDKYGISQAETDKIMNAQKARGADMDSGNVFQRVKALIPVLIPLFVSSFRRANDLAMAMECRCYNGGENRTRMKVLHFSYHDLIALIGCVLIFTAVIVSNHLFAAVM